MGRRDQHLESEYYTDLRRTLTGRIFTCSKDSCPKKREESGESFVDVSGGHDAAYKLLQAGRALWSMIKVKSRTQKQIVTVDEIFIDRFRRFRQDFELYHERDESRFSRISRASNALVLGFELKTEMGKHEDDIDRTPYEILQFENERRMDLLEDTQVSRVLRRLTMGMVTKVSSGTGESSGLPVQDRPLEKRLHLSHGHSARLCLPIVLKDKVFDAVADTGSSENVVSEEFARSIGLNIDPIQQEEGEFVNAQGGKFVSKGQTTIDCAFPSDPIRTWKCVFQVVTELAVPLVMGQRFLDLTETLTRFRSRLKRMFLPVRHYPRVLHMDIPRQRLVCSLNSEDALANADTGSDLDLISLAYANERGWKIKQIKDQRRLVQLADGAVVELAGKVIVKFQIGEGMRRKKIFYVLNGLSSDVLLGNATLDELRVFTEHADLFVEIPGEGIFFEMNLIMWKWWAKKRAQQATFEELLEAEDITEAKHRTEHKGKTEKMTAAERAVQEQFEMERRDKYHQRRAYMVNARTIVTDDEFLLLKKNSAVVV